MVFLFICLIGAPEEFLGKAKELFSKHQMRYPLRSTRTFESTPAYVMILWDNIKVRQMVRDLKRSMKEGKMVVGLTEELEWWPSHEAPEL